jgi:hypothetical protein
MATYTGETTESFDHKHEYQVDENGNGWALSVTPSLPPQQWTQEQIASISHKHAITDWVVKNAQSDCYPGCEETFGVTGSPSHSHQLEDASNSLSDIYKIHMNEYKRMYSTSNPIKQARSASGVEDVFDEEENTEQTPTSGY